jgi:hypothetical protein
MRAAVSSTFDFSQVQDVELEVVDDVTHSEKVDGLPHSPFGRPDKPHNIVPSSLSSPRPNEGNVFIAPCRGPKLRAKVRRQL